MRPCLPACLPSCLPFSFPFGFLFYLLLHFLLAVRLAFLFVVHVLSFCFLFGCLSALSPGLPLAAISIHFMCLTVFPKRFLSPTLGPWGLRWKFQLCTNGFQVITLRHGIKTSAMTFGSFQGTSQGPSLRAARTKLPGIAWDTWVVVAEEVGRPSGRARKSSGFSH